MTYITDAIATLAAEFPGADISASEDHAAGFCMFRIQLPEWKSAWMRPVTVETAHDLPWLREFFREDVALAAPILNKENQ